MVVGASAFETVPCQRMLYRFSSGEELLERKLGLGSFSICYRLGERLVFSGKVHIGERSARLGTERLGELLFPSFFRDTFLYSFPVFARPFKSAYIPSSVVSNTVFSWNNLLYSRSLFSIEVAPLGCHDSIRLG